jgi:glyoxylase-like metal-dependent hydrolase (beta-lactamase superfamily II)
MRFGDFEIIPFVEQKFRLDGGSMFGIVPKKIWGKLMEVDADNLIPMETNLFVLKTGRANILFDTGLGDCLGEREKKIYAASGETRIESGLKQMGLTTDDVDYVFLSHLHTDHAGGAVKMIDGKYVPRFNRARYVVQKREWRDGMNPDERTAAVYRPERLKVLEETGQLMLIDGDAELVPGVRVIRTGGHAPGHQAIEAVSGDTMVVYYADIMPSSHHLKVPYVPAVDLDPKRTMEVKRHLIKKLSENKSAIVFDHDIEIKIGRLSHDGDRMFFEKIE